LLAFVLLYSADTAEIVQLPTSSPTSQTNTNPPLDNQPIISGSDMASPNTPVTNQSTVRSLAELEVLVSAETEAIMAKIRTEAANRKYTDEEKKFLSDKKSFTIDKLLTEQKINTDEAVLLKSVK